MRTPTAPVRQIIPITSFCSICLLSSHCSWLQSLLRRPEAQTIQLRAQTCNKSEWCLVIAIAFIGIHFSLSPSPPWIYNFGSVCCFIFKGDLVSWALWQNQTEKEWDETSWLNHYARWQEWWVIWLTALATMPSNGSSDKLKNAWCWQQDQQALLT